MWRAAVVVVALIAGGIAACKKPPPVYDQTSPEATVASFVKAVNAKRMPADLRKLVGGPGELVAWQLRCETWGCARAEFEIVEVGPRADYTAVLYVDYRVIGDDGSQLIGGKRSPITLERIGDHWVITQFGRKIRPKPSSPNPPPPAAADAATASEPER